MSFLSVLGKFKIFSKLSSSYISENQLVNIIPSQTQDNDKNTLRIYLTSRKQVARYQISPLLRLPFQYPG